MPPRTASRPNVIRAVRYAASIAFLTLALLAGAGAYIQGGSTNPAVAAVVAGIAGVLLWPTAREQGRRA